MDYSVVIPCCNEEWVIEKTVERFQQLFNHTSFEIILTIEQSDSMTIEVAKQLKKKYQNVRLLENNAKHGKGYSVRRGVLSSQGDYVLVMDADMPVQIEKYFPIMNKLIEDPSVAAIYVTALGDKTNGAKRGRLRAEASFWLFFLRRLFLKHNITDTQMGCKLYRGNIARTFYKYLNEKGFLFELHITDLILNAGYSIEECSVRIEEFSEKSSIRFSSLIKSFGEFFFYILRGRKVLLKKSFTSRQIFKSDANTMDMH
ncbi:glycosyltransferase involved in cell wall bisynthesis [Ureibacillus xyleni]|uniref:Glycosyltransferase involved in cell wall bisynthesis n=1 Tax=Ureibacillus xyleni TaxID=614648 RepID=A0A285SSE6_9BACL|nr:glycosyltransferase [Ureibacillus xyleni]SOC11295.1 glycosyltransferase involved in cell wall bisynthesis [Ureibacillus xyleni]